MDFAEYAQIDAVNWSTLKEMRRSPLHYLHRRKTEREDSVRLALGRAAHTAVFEPDRFMLDYACFDGDRRAGKAWAAFQVANPGRTLIKREEYELALAMRDAVRKHPIAEKLLAEKGEPEKTITWTDKLTELPCKARLDWFRAGILLDLKTTGDVDARRFGNLAVRMGYHCQCSFYRSGLIACGLGDSVPRIIAVEAKPPHDVAVYRVGEDALFAADQEVAELLAKVAAGRFSGQWPGRYPEEQELELPAWAFEDEEDPTGLGLVIAGAEN